LQKVVGDKVTGNGYGIHGHVPAATWSIVNEDSLQDVRGILIKHGIERGRLFKRHPVGDQLLRIDLANHSPGAVVPAWLVPAPTERRRNAADLTGDKVQTVAVRLAAQRHRGRFAAIPAANDDAAAEATQCDRRIERLWRAGDLEHQ